MRIPLTNQQGILLPLGTRLSYIDPEGNTWVGHKGGSGHFFQFNPLKELYEDPWAIGDWDLYAVMSDEDFVLWKLENA